MDYKNEEEDEKEERKKETLDTNSVAKNVKISRKERIPDIFNSDIENEFIQQLADLYIAFNNTDADYEQLTLLLNNCPSNFLIYFIEIFLFLSKESIDYIHMFISEDIFRNITRIIISALQETKDTILLVYDLLDIAVKNNIFDEIPHYIVEFPFTISTILESDTNLFLKRKGFNPNPNTSSISNVNQRYSQCLQSLNQSGLIFLNSLLIHNLVHDPELIDELYQKMFYFVQVPIDNLRGTALQGISLLSNLNPEVSFGYLSNLDSTQMLLSYLKPNNP